MPTIPTRPLGRTDLSVTRLGYGAMEIRGGQDRWRVWDAAKLDVLLGEGESRTQWMLAVHAEPPRG